MSVFITPALFFTPPPGTDDEEFVVVSPDEVPSPQEAEQLLEGTNEQLEDVDRADVRL